jgi:hypothetical protein
MLLRCKCTTQIAVKYGLGNKWFKETKKISALPESMNRVREMATAVSIVVGILCSVPDLESASSTLTV